MAGWERWPAGRGGRLAAGGSQGGKALGPNAPAADGGAALTVTDHGRAGPKANSRALDLCMGRVVEWGAVHVSVRLCVVMLGSCMFRR